MCLKDILQYKGVLVHMVEVNSPIEDVIAQLVRFNIASLVVFRQRRAGQLELVGIITERDILRKQFAMGSDFWRCAAGDVMSSTLITASPSDSIERALELMTKYRVRHLPLVDDDGLCGIVSMGDIVKAVHDELQVENHFIRNYIHGVS